MQKCQDEKKKHEFTNRQLIIIMRDNFFEKQFFLQCRNPSEIHAANFKIYR